MRSWHVVCALVAGVGLVACGAESSTTESVPAATDLAPSQLSASTVPAPAATARCDPDLIRIEVVEPEAGVGQPDQIVELVNEGDRECDVDISATASAAEEMEPSVRLAPREVGQAWIEAVEGCDGSATELELDVNGKIQKVELLTAASCDVEVTAFFTD